MSDENNVWQLQVVWTETVLERYTTFEDAHDRAVELVRTHPTANGNVFGRSGTVSVGATYYRFQQPSPQESPTT